MTSVKKISLITLSAIALAMLISIWWLLRTPQVSVKPQIQHGRFAFSIQSDRRVRKITWVRVFSIAKQHYLWEINTKRLDKQSFSVVYGNLPAMCEQVFPEGQEEPEPVHAKDQLVVRVWYTFDNVFPPAACSSTANEQIVVPKQG